MNSDGTLEDLLQGRSSYNQNSYINSETSQFILGYGIEKDGKILLPVIGSVDAAGKTIIELRNYLQNEIDKYYKGSYVECKLLSFKYTVLGEVKVPGSYVNYNNYLTVLEGIGRAGGVGDSGRRDRVIVVRSSSSGTETFRVNLQEKELLSSEAYFLQPNDLIIIEPVKHKIFNMNLPTYSFILTSITGTVSTALLLINFLNK
jgi:polysaccharide export outer membrane protein